MCLLPPADGRQQVQADAVVLATGGFSASKELLAQYNPLAAQLPTTNGPWASGDGIKLGQGLGEWRCTAAALLRCCAAAQCCTVLQLLARGLAGSTTRLTTCPQAHMPLQPPLSTLTHHHWRAPHHRTRHQPPHHHHPPPQLTTPRRCPAAAHGAGADTPHWLCGPRRPQRWQQVFGSGASEGLRRCHAEQGRQALCQRAGPQVGVCWRCCSCWLCCCCRCCCCRRRHVHGCGSVYGVGCCLLAAREWQRGSHGVTALIRVRAAHSWLNWLWQALGSRVVRCTATPP
jgi:hypothetical protein